MKAGFLEHVRQRKAAAIVVLMCVALMIAGVAIRPAPQSVTLSAEATAIFLDLKAQAVVEDSIPLRQDGFTSGAIRSASLDGVGVDPQVAQARIDGFGGRGLTLERLSFAAGSRLSVRQGGRGCVLLTLVAGQADLDLIGHSNISEATVRFGIGGDPAGSSEFAFCPVASFRLTLYGVSRAAFERRFQPNSMQSFAMSSLESATLSFPATGSHLDLVPLEGLLVGEMEADRPLVIEARGSDQPLKLAYVGRVGRLTTGSGEGRRLLPRLIEHFFGQSPIATVLGAFGFFWSLTWGFLTFWRSSARV